MDRGGRAWHTLNYTQPLTIQKDHSPRKITLPDSYFLYDISTTLRYFNEVMCLQGKLQCMGGDLMIRIYIYIYIYIYI